MAILNPSFEEAGTFSSPGEASHWQLVTYTALERIAGFGPEPYQGFENFDRWFVHLHDFGSYILMPPSITYVAVLVYVVLILITTHAYPLAFFVRGFDGFSLTFMYVSFFVFPA